MHILHIVYACSPTTVITHFLWRALASTALKLVSITYYYIYPAMHEFIVLQLQPGPDPWRGITPPAGLFKLVLTYHTY